MNESIIRRVGLTKQTGKTDKRGKRIFYILMFIVFFWFIATQLLGNSEQSSGISQADYVYQGKFYGKNRMGAVSRLLFRGSMMLQKMRQWCLLCNFRKLTENRT